MGLPLIYGSPPRREESEPYPGRRLPTLRFSRCGQQHSFHHHQVHLICPQTAVRCWMLGFRSCATPLGTFRRGALYLYVQFVTIFFFLRAHLFVLAPLSETSDGVGTIRRPGSRCRRFGRDPCSVSRGASPLNVFGLGHTEGKSPGFRNIPGDWVSASPIPVYARKIWMQTGFFCS